MGYVPKDVEWFVAEIVIEIRVEGDTRNVVHNNFTLVKANSPETAYEKALALGRAQENDYLNPAGKKVRFRFRGLRDLHCIDDPLEHGGEVLFEEKIAVPEEEIEKMLTPKEKLGVFQPWAPPRRGSKPDYAAKDIIEALEKAGFKRPRDDSENI